LLIGGGDAASIIASGNFTMTATTIIAVVDRFALSLMSAIALVGVPVVAIGVLTQTL
jgi:hypothetical protein